MSTVAISSLGLKGVGSAGKSVAFRGCCRIRLSRGLSCNPAQDGLNALEWFAYDYPGIGDLEFADGGIERTLAHLDQGNQAIQPGPKLDVAQHEHDFRERG